MTEPNVAARRRAKQLGQPFDGASPSMPTVMDNDNENDVLGPSNDTRGRLDQHKAFSGRLSSKQSTSGEASIQDIEIASPNVSTGTQSTQAKSSSSQQPSKPASGGVDKKTRATNNGTRAGGKQRADLTSSRLLREALQDTSAKATGPRPNIMTRGRARQLRESFFMFPMLPQELRLKVWHEAAPRYGLYPVRCYLKELEEKLEEEEPLGRQPGPGGRPYTIAIQPRARVYWSPGFAERARATRSLLLACRESRGELRFLFPDAVSCPVGELRFNGERDVVMLAPSQYFDVQCILRDMMSLASFADDWHRKVRKLGVVNFLQRSMLIRLFFVQDTTAPHHVQASVLESLQNLLGFLGRFDEGRAGSGRLRQLIIADEGVISCATWNKANADCRSNIVEVLRECRRADVRLSRPVMPLDGCPHEFQDEAFWLDRHCEFAKLLESVIQGRSPRSLRTTLQTAHIDIESGYPELQGVEIVKLVTLDPALAHLCPELEFD